MNDRRDTGTSDAALLRSIVRAAANAPSAHNTQPWEPRITAHGIELGVARGRTLPFGDPTGRDTLLALGAWTECAVVAADAAGRGLDVTVRPALADPSAIVAGRSDDVLAELRLRAAPDGATGAGDAAGPDDVAPAGGRSSAPLGNRLTFRGRMHADPGLLEGASFELPSWLRLVPISAKDLAHFSSLGTADVLTRPGVAEELAGWLRLAPMHPRYDVDGLTDRTMLLPIPLARLAAGVTRRRRLRNLSARAARRTSDLVRRLLLEVHLDAAGDDADAAHFVLVADANRLDLGRGMELTRVLNAPLGLPADRVFEAGRALLRVWLFVTRRGAAFAPHSEVLDSALAQGELQYRLGLDRRDVPLFVTSVGVPAVAEPPRSARRRVV